MKYVGTCRGGSLSWRLGRWSRYSKDDNVGEVAAVAGVIDGVHGHVVVGVVPVTINKLSHIQGGPSGWRVE